MFPINIIGINGIRNSKAFFLLNKNFKLKKNIIPAIDEIKVQTIKPGTPAAKPHSVPK